MMPRALSDALFFVCLRSLSSRDLNARMDALRLGRAPPGRDAEWAAEFQQFQQRLPGPVQEAMFEREFARAQRAAGGSSLSVGA